MIEQRRHELSSEDAAKIVVRHLRKCVTIVGGLPRGETPGGTPGQPAGEDARATMGDLPREVPAIWLRQLTDEAGFEIIYVAALRSVGVPARLDANAMRNSLTATSGRLRRHRRLSVGKLFQPAATRASQPRRFCNGVVAATRLLTGKVTGAL